MKVLNIKSDSDDWRAKELSNFPFRPFVLDGESFASVEGFIQGIKFPVGDSRRFEAFDSWGKAAKSIGQQAEKKSIWWKVKVFKYGSKCHHRLIERAIRAKFEYNEKSLNALIETGNLVLIHDTGEEEAPDTSLPAKVFCDILTRIREEYYLDE